MLKIPLVEDERAWAKKIQESLNSHGIQVVWLRDGEKLLKCIREDEGDQYRTVLVDWKLPGMSGPEIARQLIDLKPYLRLFAITTEDNLDEVARIMKDYPFHGFISKRSLDNKVRLETFVNEIKVAAKEVEETLICRPFLNKHEHRNAYLTLRGSREWSKIERVISEKASTLLDEGSFQRRRTLRDCLPTKSSGLLLIENILIARRIILAEIFNRHGKLHEVEKSVGYQDENDLVYDDAYKMYDSAFKNYCSEIGLRPDDFRNTGKDILPEEEKWLNQWCEDSQISVRFPVT